MPVSQRGGISMLDDKWVNDYYEKQYQKGSDAFWEGIPFASNPHREATGAYDQWHRGWRDTFQDFTSRGVKKDGKATAVADEKSR